MHFLSLRAYPKARPAPGSRGAGTGSRWMEGAHSDAWWSRALPPRSLNLFLLISNPNLIAPLEDTSFEETSCVVEELIIAEM